MTTLGDVVAALDALFPPSLAEPWDAVGLVCGDPASPVRRVLLAVDPAPVVADEAVTGGFDLLVTHHPLFLGGTTTVAADDPKGRVVHDLVRGGAGLFVAHTNADRARGGVNDGLADVFGLRDTEPLERVPEPVDKLIVFVPLDAAEKVRAAIGEAGAGRIGDYDCCSWSTEGEGVFRPLPGANPNVGEVGSLERVHEVRIETVVPRAARDAVLAAMRAAHPYETPAYDVVPVADLPGDTGLGRVGDLPGPMTLAELTRRAAELLPATASGVRAAGDPDQVVRRLAVCGGSGESTARAAVAAGAQALLTADLKHHRALGRPQGLSLVDASHWATEWPWLVPLGETLTRVVGVECVVSTRRTDPWTTAARSPEA